MAIFITASFEASTCLIPVPVTVAAQESTEAVTSSVEIVTDKIVKYATSIACKSDAVKIQLVTSATVASVSYDITSEVCRVGTAVGFSVKSSVRIAGVVGSSVGA